MLHPDDGGGPHAQSTATVPGHLGEVTGEAAAQVLGPAQRPERLGVHLASGGVDAVVHAPHANAVELCLLDEGAGGLTERRIDLLPSQHGRWGAHIAGVSAGQRYGFRVHGPWDREHGQLHNPAKLLLDPYARAVTGTMDLRGEVYGGVVDQRLQPTADDGPDTRDSAAFVPLGVVTAPLPAPATPRPRITWGRTVIYEAHVRGLTMNNPKVPEYLRGTYAGVGHPATIAHLRDLGVTTLELLPIHAKVTEPSLRQRGAVNYWGYSTLSYFAPEPSYATAAAQRAGSHQVLAEVQQMVADLHAAGLEVVLDVVYNHTGEGGVDGPMLSWRGLDNAGYYLHEGTGHHNYLDVTGTGNSLDFRSTHVVQITLDSLRYWVEQIGVDGFRFDLAVTMGRNGTAFDPRHPLLVAMACDPVLAGVKQIAEPWDIGPGGWRTGQFAAPMVEWNDRYRDVLRTFWLTDLAEIERGGHGHDLRKLATCLAGSADMFAHTSIPGGRGPTASINFVTAHDGFTLRDLVSYQAKHNWANGEDNRDGTDDNRSYNHGVEGPTDDPQVTARRRRAMRNLLGTVAVSAGTPMLTAGDELGRTQHGNNNAYARDDQTVWLDWQLEHWQEDLRATVAHLLTLRREHEALRPSRFGSPRGEHHEHSPTIAWFDAGGEPMSLDTWYDPQVRVLQMFRHAPLDAGRNALVVLNGSTDTTQVILANPEHKGLQLYWDSVWEHPGAGQRRHYHPGTAVPVDELSLQIYLDEALPTTPGEPAGTEARIRMDTR